MLKANRRTAPALISQRVEFDASTLSARWVYSPDFGRLSPKNRQLIAQDWRNASSGRLYVVYSYATPIAWYNGEIWTIPADKYSVTTSRHQSIARRGISIL